MKKVLNYLRISSKRSSLKGIFTSCTPQPDILAKHACFQSVLIHLIHPQGSSCCGRVWRIQLVEKRDGYTVEIVWHRRETRRLTEETNVNLYHSENPVYSPKAPVNFVSYCSLKKEVFIKLFLPHPNYRWVNDYREGTINLAGSRLINP